MLYSRESESTESNPDGTGNFATGAISYLVDALGGAVAYVEGRPMNVSVDVSISFLSMAKPDVSCHLLAPNPHFSSYVFPWFAFYLARLMSWRLPQGFKAGKGGYSGTVILIRNKATGEVVAEGRHSFFSKRTSEL
ncbi:hypothetical protein RHMOL_Rhmol13G0090400 [Rhododendron molle]|uniref:Uncharacterized protein n=1 Tax=Rhododendron molle TaxID=49168 RepID=A0ACC0L4J4_RHOML|nr:hypothetical protein RHMOL_Rhmol13G0090400 [Rhododendron molle]